MWQSIKLVLYYLAYQLTCGMVASGIFAIINLTQGKPVMGFQTPTWALALVLVVSTLLMMWHLVHFNYVKIKRDILKPVPVRPLLYSILLVFCSIYVLNVLSEVLKLPNYMEDSFISLSHNAMGLLSMTILAPLLEEMLFRGAIEGHLLRIGKSPAFSIIVSALIFGVIHLNPAQILFAFLTGLIFGWLYYRTGSLLPAILGHILNNSLAAFTLNLYGNATNEEVMGETNMYIWTAVAIVISVGLFFVLNRSLPKADFKENQSVFLKEE